MKYLLLLSFQLCFYVTAFSNPVDSLFNALKKADDGKKLIIYEELCVAYYSIDLDSAALFANKKLEIANKLSDIQHTAVSYKLLGNVNYFKGENKQAIAFYEKALENARKKQLTEIEASAINNMGGVYRNLGEYQKALDCYQQVLKIDSTNNNLGGIGSSLTNVGNIYLDQSQYAEAIDHYKRALEIALELNDVPRIISAYNNLGLAYHWISDYDRTSKFYFLALKRSEEIEDYNSMLHILVNLGSLYHEWENLPKALELYNKAKTISEKINDSPNLVRALESIGVILYEQNEPDSAIKILKKTLDIAKKMDDPKISSSLFVNLGYAYELKQDYVKAKEYYARSLALRKEIDNADDIASTLYYLGHISFKTKNYSEAINYIEKSNQLAVNLSTKISNYKLLADIYEKTKNTAKAFHYLKLYSSLKDSVFTAEKHQQIQELQTKYETEKKEQQIATLSKEKEIEILKNQQSKYYIFSLLALLVVLVLISVLFIRNNRLKAHHKNIELEQRLFRSQMNPHFIFNAISSIQDFVMNKNPLEASSYLSNFAKLMRSILHHSSTEFILLEDEIETLEHYLKLQKLRFSEKLEYEIIVPDDLEVDELAIPPMLSQPFIENSIKHGISKKKEGKGKVVVEFATKGNSLLLSIKDDGVGLSNIKKNKDKVHRSMATKITRSRIDNFKKEYKKNVKFEVKNIVNDTNEILGVEVEIELPIKHLG